MTLPATSPIIDLDEPPTNSTEAILRVLSLAEKWRDAPWRSVAEKEAARKLCRAIDQFRDVRLKEAKKEMEGVRG